MKLCKDCKWNKTTTSSVAYGLEKNECLCPDLAFVSPVDGSKREVDSETARIMGKCGREAKYFEAREDIQCIKN